ncbi:cytochrome-c peroxidase [Xanthomonas euroxanthea]|uniref:cytochrome-c peroxidase n=1 Tax=Xanthomonas euroxanthea TaxID=2259622 RepID=UPI00141BB98B|nr:cytochrome c peroxidase [Xanthomonas euroxanthea]
MLAACCVAGHAVPERTNTPVPRDCRATLALSSNSVDVACLRLAYAGPQASWPKPEISEGAVWQELAPLPAKAPTPADNPTTVQKVALGRKLFEDPRLSSSGQIACANCHDPELGWGDGRSVSFGHNRQQGRRNAPSVAMSGFAESLFWDGRAGSLEEQIRHPIEDGKEMAFSLPAMVERLNQSDDYPGEFGHVFGSSRITEKDIAQALAAFERSLVPRANRYDRFLQGQRELLNDQQLWGLHLFRTKARCMNCHSGPTLADNRFHNLGLHFYGRQRQDLGRYEVTQDVRDSGKFRTPSLRNVRKTGPYMHTGGFADLRSVVNAYNAGMPRPKPKGEQIDDPLFPKPDPLLRPLGLQKEERDAIVAFLETL